MEESHEEGSQLIQIGDKYADIANSYAININHEDMNYSNMLR
jgi:hypothetical protein